MNADFTFDAAKLGVARNSDSATERLGIGIPSHIQRRISFCSSPQENELWN